MWRRAVRILNSEARPIGHEPVELSRVILQEARELEGADRCARLDALAGELHGLDPAGIDGDGARLAFWINLYNALLLHCLCLAPIRGNVLLHLRMFRWVAYRVGGPDFTLDVIEHGVLRGNRRRPYSFLRPLRAGDRRLSAAPSRLDPRLHFALNCGARSCPPIRAYDVDGLDAQFELATRSYLAQELDLDRDRDRVVMPRLMRIYRADFGRRRDQLAFAAAHLPEDGSAWLRDRIESIRVRYGRFDWRVAE